MDYVKKEQVRLLHRLSSPTYIMSYLITIVVTIAYRDLMPTSFIVWWFSAATLIAIVRGALGAVYKRVEAYQNNPDLWGNIYCVGTFIAGVNWSVFAVQFNSDWPSVYQVVMFTIQAGLIAGAIGTHSCYFPALTCFYSPIVVALIWVSVQQVDDGYLWLVPLTVFFWITVFIGGRRFSKALASSIHFQHSLSIANDKLELISRLDSLTQLNNRGALDHYLTHTWLEHTKRALPVAVAMIDIDKFKAYNDYYGHVDGDLCLARVAAVLRKSISEDIGFLARYGGEEFIAVLPGMSAEDAYPILNNILTSLSEEAIEHKASPVSEYVTLSVGIESAVPLVNDDWMPLIKRADAKLYVAKQQGRAQIVI